MGGYIFLVTHVFCYQQTMYQQTARHHGYTMSGIHYMSHK